MIVVYLVFYAILVGSLFYQVNERYGLKVLSIVVLFTLATSVYFSFDEFKGWPSAELPANGLEVIYLKVDEPQGESKGAIYVWVIPHEQGDSTLASLSPGRLMLHDTAGKPRVFTYPYSEQGAKKAYQAMEAIQQGMTVTTGKEVKDPKSGNGDPAEDSHDGDQEGGKASGSAHYDNSTIVDFQILNPVDALKK